MAQTADQFCGNFITRDDGPKQLGGETQVENSARTREATEGEIVVSAVVTIEPDHMRSVGSHQKVVNFVPAIGFFLSHFRTGEA